MYQTNSSRLSSNLFSHNPALLSTSVNFVILSTALSRTTALKSVILSDPERAKRIEGESKDPESLYSPRPLKPFQPQNPSLPAAGSSHTTTNSAASASASS